MARACRSRGAGPSRHAGHRSVAGLGRGQGVRVLLRGLLLVPAAGERERGCDGEVVRFIIFMVHCPRCATIWPLSIVVRVDSPRCRCGSTRLSSRQFTGSLRAIIVQPAVHQFPAGRVHRAAEAREIADSSVGWSRCRPCVPASKQQAAGDNHMPRRRGFAPERADADVEIQAQAMAVRGDAQARVDDTQRQQAVELVVVARERWSSARLQLRRAVKASRLPSIAATTPRLETHAANSRAMHAAAAGNVAAAEQGKGCDAWRGPR